MRRHSIQRRTIERSFWMACAAVTFTCPPGAAAERPAGPPDKVAAPERITSTIRSPIDELRGFTVPAGFEVELVAAESQGIGKFVALAFDARGRMWTMTALEYPLDANENPQASQELFASGGRDKVLVFDRPFDREVPPPQVFADGLVIPLGILPYRDGALVQYGSEIRFYHDENGDGRADGHRVVLTGFGTQDSHLFPHQFTRAPGGWILMAQGLFNSSVVFRPGGIAFADGRTEIRFDHCKLARFTADGSLFESLSAGPNNIWGLTVSREGEIWIQEANDLGYPIIPYEPGGYYTTGSPDRLKPYQPLMPPTVWPPQMGGTGLSGLALADDRDGWPLPWGFAGAEADSPRVFYVANPIVSRIQAIRAVPDRGRYRYEKLPDFLVSEDARFRPVAIQFGPDGCLYIVDWYNKIISHNEVPREHPERDKVRGRIWRIRHKSQPRKTPVVLADLDTNELIDHLGGPNARISDLAWQEIVDRRAVDLQPQLESIVRAADLPADRRLAALWALEGLGPVADALLEQLARDPNANIRREAVRIAGVQWRSEEPYMSIGRRAMDDASPKVRAALGDALRRLPRCGPHEVALMLRLAREPLPGSTWDAYDRNFERYLARWAMENNAPAVAEFLQSPESAAYPVEHRTLAAMALSAQDSAAGLARLIPELNRPLDAEEIRVLASHFDRPEVAATIHRALERPESTLATLRSLLTLRAQIDTSALSGAIEHATESLWPSELTHETRLMLLRMIGGFRVRSLEQQITALAADGEAAVELRLAALRSLREIGVSHAGTLASLVRDENTGLALRAEALATLAESPSAEVLAEVRSLLALLPEKERSLAIERLATHRGGAEMLLQAVESQSVPAEALSLAVIDALRTLLPGNELLDALWNDAADRVQYVLKLNGGNEDFIDEPIHLIGPFTVESWVRLSPGIDNRDGILARPHVVDMNFHAGQLRVWLEGHHDIVVAQKGISPHTWVHCAVARDAEGVFRIYINGQLDGESVQSDTRDLTDLRVGRTMPDSGGTDAQLAELRIWNVERTADEIRDNFDLGFEGGLRPNGLVYYGSGKAWGALHGDARIEPTPDGPRLLSPAEARGREEKFETYRALAAMPGDLERGRTLFAAQCLKCHSYAGQGGQIGPALDGIGLAGTESLLRHLLTPSAAMEGGYRSYRVVTHDGRILQGMLVAEEPSGIVLRRPDAADQRIARADIDQCGYTSQSIMPDGLLEALAPQEAGDLLAYLLSLRQGQSSHLAPRDGR